MMPHLNLFPILLRAIGGEDTGSQRGCGSIFWLELHWIGIDEVVALAT